MYFDIHSHILPKVDDGSQSLSESLKLLQMMKEQGISSVIATPHFYPDQDSLEIFKETVDTSFKALKIAAARHNLPDIHLGCELFYFNNISKVTSLDDFCLNGSKYLLLELTEPCINPTLFKEIQQLRSDLKITPIIAHTERYCKARHYKKFIKFLEEENIPIQINASSFSFPFLKRAALKLLKTSLFCVLATDTHSIEGRPPELDLAFNVITKVLGEDVKTKLIENSNMLYEKIILQGDNSDKNR